LSFLHADNFIPDANVFPNLSLGHSLDDLVEVGESFSASKKVKMFAGYAGWSPGQLENEMKRNRGSRFRRRSNSSSKRHPTALAENYPEQRRLEK